MSEKLVSQRQELRGVGVSSGIGFGHARVMQTSSLQVPRYSVTAEDVDKEIGRLKGSGPVSRELDQMIRRSPKGPKEVEPS
ncbi:MAG: phosphoenolpyruvate-utilizing N-terminal domain-containing protein [Parasutterella sp.]